ncbi:type IV secretion system DNA-binding domain-containing protein [Streptomyces fungicidicus]|uniref:type IV secretion system DNA-binding domain-containing protein n=1 Tax=Streptomyces fungicidicus TaxID=68203 RepID=UPI003680FA92
MPAYLHWGKVLGIYDDEAPATLPSQLDLLRALQDLDTPDVALVYRLRTSPEGGPNAEPSALFDLRCLSRDRETISAAEARTLDDLSAVALLPAYNILGASELRVGYKYRTRIVPSARRGDELPIKRDWAELVDLFRRREDDVALDITCTLTDVRVGKHRASLRTGHITSIDRATAFFEAAAAECRYHQEGQRQLMVTVTLQSTAPIDQVFARTTGRMLFGTPVRLRPVQRYRPITSSPALGVVGCPEQLIRVWHAPYGNMQGRGLGSWRDTRIAMRRKPPKVEAGVTLGRARWHGARFTKDEVVEISDADRTKHTYVVGKTGSGKTNVLKSLVRQDIRNGNGCAVIDPHGDLVDYALEHAGDRVEDVVHLDFGDPAYLPVVNPFLIDVEAESDYQMAVEEILEIIIRRSYSQFTGPVFDDTTRLMLKTIWHQEIRGDLLPSIPLALEVLRTPGMRKWAAGVLGDVDPELADQWRAFEGMLASSVAETVRWAAAKFADFTSGNPLQLLTAGSSPLSFQDIYDERKILLVKLPETMMGPMSGQFLGSLMFNRIYRAARAGGSAKAAPFFIHVDEFQRFVSHEVEELVAEARKFNVGLTFAHQNLRQLEAFSRYEGSANARLAEAIFSNVGTMIVMKTSGRDVKAFADEFSVNEAQVRNIAQYEALARTVIGNVEQPAFSLVVGHEVSGRGDASVAGRVRERMIAQGIMRPRDELRTLQKDLESFRAHGKPGRPRAPERRPSRDSSPPSGDAPFELLPEGPEDAPSPSSSSPLDDWLARRKSRKGRVARADPEPADAPSDSLPLRS